MLKKSIEETKGLDVAKGQRYTVGQWMDVWYEYYAQIKVRPSHKTYEGYIKDHVEPSTGSIPLVAQYTSSCLIQMERSFYPPRNSTCLMTIFLKSLVVTSKSLEKLSQFVCEGSADIILNQLIKSVQDYVWGCERLCGNSVNGLHDDPCRAPPQKRWDLMRRKVSVKPRCL